MLVSCQEFTQTIPQEKITRDPSLPCYFVIFTTSTLTPLLPTQKNCSDYGCPIMATLLHVTSVRSRTSALAAKIFNAVWTPTARTNAGLSRDDELRQKWTNATGERLPKNSDC